MVVAILAYFLSIMSNFKTWTLVLGFICLPIDLLSLLKIPVCGVSKPLEGAWYVHLRASA